jgi:hypothetical protein
MKQEMAHVSGWDEGNRSMRNGERTAWSIEDYNAAVKKFNDISNNDSKKTDRRVK